MTSIPPCHQPFTKVQFFRPHCFFQNFSLCRLTILCWNTMRSPSWNIVESIKNGLDAINNICFGKTFRIFFNKIVPPASGLSIALFSLVFWNPSLLNASRIFSVGKHSQCLALFTCQQSSFASIKHQTLHPSNLKLHIFHLFSLMVLQARQKKEKFGTICLASAATSRLPASSNLSGILATSPISHEVFYSWLRTSALLSPSPSTVLPLSIQCLRYRQANMCCLTMQEDAGQYA